MKKCPNCGEFVSSEAIQCTNCDMYFDGQERVDFRCTCHNLLAKVTGKTIEIKCRRCKRIHVLKIEEFDEYFDHLLQTKGADENIQIDHRCGCENLLAKLTDVAVRIKCRCCKHIESIPVSMIQGFHQLNLDKKP